MTIKNKWLIPEIKLVYQPKIMPSRRAQVIHSQDAYQIFLSVWDLNTIYMVEEFKLMLLNTDGRVLGIGHLTRGTINGTIIDPRIVFALALKGLAASIIICHNHPSGNSKPSKKDIDLTRQLVEIGGLLGIKVADHLIITPTGYTSLAAKKLIDC